jgi:hypothetical protein
MADPRDQGGQHADEVLGKADALLARHRGARSTARAEPPVDFPVLTDVVHDAPAPAPPPAPTEEQLAQIERDLRLELLGLLGPEFERLVEARVHERLGGKIEEVLGLTRKVLEAEVRNAVRDAVAQVITEESARLKGGS